ncbi:MAG: cupredoxin domain-containing protein, partial [Candidatus Aquicultor sp.]
PGSLSSTLSFNIKAEGGKFIPSKIIGRSGDTMIINFTAVDNNYSIVFPSYNMRQVAKKGETKMLGFHTSETGSFTYYCDICGANTTATGTIIVTK